jgi:predicted metal-binding membrane protein
VNLESTLKQDRRVVMGGLALVVALAWGYLLAGAGVEMDGHETARISSAEGIHVDSYPAAMQSAIWTYDYVLLMFLMWWIMMAAMMLPSAAPTILLAAALNRKARADRAPYGGSGFFAAGYLIAWGFFSLVAVVAQWGLAKSGLLSSTMHSTSPVLAGGLLIAAGIWQFTSIKQACLRHCRSPVQYLTRRRRKGNAGSLGMGMEHGAYCLGCCWFLMALLFVGGVMNLYWIMGLAVYVLGEKILPAGHRIGRLAGAGLVAWGVGLIAGLI